MRRDFENEVPIDDAMTVLDLLSPRWGDDTYRRVHLPYVRPGSPNYMPAYMEIRHCHDFGDDDVHRFRITERAARELLDERLVSGEKHWGYTDMRELSINESGVTRLYAAREKAGLPLDFRSEEWIQHHPWGAA